MLYTSILIHFMKSVSLLLIFLFFLTSCNQSAIPTQIQKETTTTTYIFIRHAEKDLSDPNNRNPNLTEEGKTRAENWAKILADTKVDIIYTTDYIRTQKTAEPIATSQGLETTIYNPKDLNDSDFQKKTKGKTTVIVGHSNTTPSFVNKIIGENKYKSIDEKIYGKIFILTITNNTITDIVLHIN